MNTEQLTKAVREVAKQNRISQKGRAKKEIDITAMCLDIIPALEMLKMYEEIGTIGRFYIAAEKQKAIKPDYEETGCRDGEIVCDIASCPRCGKKFEYKTNGWESNYCQDCGQKLDWSD